MCCSGACKDYVKLGYFKVSKSEVRFIVEVCVHMVKKTKVTTMTYMSS